MRRTLEHFDHIGVDLDELQQEIFVAGLDQLRFFLLRRKVWHVIDAGVLQTEEIFARGFCDGDMGDILHSEVEAEVVETSLWHQTVSAKCFLIKEHGFFQMRGVKQFLVVVLVEAPYVDSQFFQQPNRLLAVIARRLDGLGPTVSEE